MVYYVEQGTGEIYQEWTPSGPTGGYQWGKSLETGYKKELPNAVRVEELSNALVLQQRIRSETLSREGVERAAELTRQEEAKAQATQEEWKPTGTEVMTPTGGMTLTPEAYKTYTEKQQAVQKIFTPQFVPEKTRPSELAPYQESITSQTNPLKKLVETIKQPATEWELQKLEAKTKNVFGYDISAVPAFAGGVWSGITLPAQFIREPVETAKGFVDFESFGYSLFHDPARLVGGMVGAAPYFKGAGRVAYELKVPMPKIRNVEIELAGKLPETKTIWTGLALEKGVQSKLLIGYKAGEGIKLGGNFKAPLISKEMLSEKAVSPLSSTSAEVFKKTIDLTQLEKERLDLINKVRQDLELTKSPYITKDIIKEVASFQKPEVAVDVYLKWAKKLDAESYGSFAAMQQMPKEVIMRKAGDIDSGIKMSEAALELKVKDLVKQLNKAGERVRVSAEKPLLVESYIPKEGKWVHAVDVHSVMRSLYGDEVPEGAYGLRYGILPPKKIQGNRFMQLAEHISRKGGSAAGISARGIYPEAHRFKDITDFIGIAKWRKEVSGKPTKDIEQLIKTYPEAEQTLIKEAISKRAFTLEDIPIKKTEKVSMPKSVAPYSMKVSVPSYRISPSRVSPSISKSTTSVSIITSPSPSISLTKYSTPSYSPSKYSPPSVSPSPSISPSISPSPYRSPSPSPSPSPSKSPSPSPYYSPTKYSPPPYNPPSKSLSGFASMLKQGFIPLVRRHGKFTPVSKKPMSLAAALGLGAKAVRETPAATFKLQKVKAAVVEEGYGGYNPEQFYRKGELYIEKPKYRIREAGEIFGIQRKGVEAMKRKWRLPKIKVMRI